MNRVRSAGHAVAQVVVKHGTGLGTVLVSLGVAIWLVVGVLRGFSEAWEGLLWSVSAAVTMIMVFLIQHTANRQWRAVLFKLDELIRADTTARNTAIGVEKRPMYEQEHLEYRLAHPHEDDREVTTVEDLAGLVELVEADQGLYLRYSKGPEHDLDRTSVDYESDLELPGLSVTVLDAPGWWTRSLTDWLSRQVCKYADLEGNGLRPWVLTGHEVGYGPDHEPLVVDAAPVAWLGEQVMAQAADHYHANFHVGRDAAEE